MLSLLDADIVAQLRNHQSSEYNTEDFLPDLTCSLEQMLGHEKLTLLRDILTELINVNESKWEETKEEDLFPDILHNPKNMQSLCTLKDLQTIAKAMEIHTGRCWFSAKLKKNENINNIVRAFQCQSLVDVQQNATNVPTQMKSLQFLCREVIKKDKYPTICLQFSYAYALLLLNKNIWNEKCKISQYGIVPNHDGTKVETVFQYFLYPEFSKSWHQV